MAEEEKQINIEKDINGESEKAVLETMEEKFSEKDSEEKDLEKTAIQAAAKSIYGRKKKERVRGGRREEKEGEFEQRVIDVARVTRVMAGGKRMRFRVCVAIGNKNGQVAIGLAKGADVSAAVQKAVNKARKNIVSVPIFNGTIPHAIYHKKGAAKILLRPAAKGRGVIAGGVARTILELAGIKNVTSKILGTNNKVNNVKCVIEALKSLKRIERKEGDNKEKKNKKEKEINKNKI